MKPFILAQLTATLRLIAIPTKRNDAPVVPSDHTFALEELEGSDHLGVEKWSERSVDNGFLRAVGIHLIVLNMHTK